MNEPLPGINQTAVTRWITENVAGAAEPYQFELITGGHSNLTFKATAADGKAYVLRRPPLGAVLATAHDMGREHRIISGVQQTDVPVPKALALCSDEAVNGAPFYIMEYVEGVVFHDDETVAAHLGEAQRAALSRSLIEVLAALHQADPDRIGLGDLGRKEAYLDRQLKRWHGQWEKTKTRELPAMDEAYQRLLADKPEQRYTGIVHGDYRLGNLLADPATGTITGVLDWELCTLGDVLADVGYLLNNWVQPDEDSLRGATAFPTRAGGFSTREELVAAYVELTGFDDLTPTTFEYYRAFQHWRLAAIVEGVLSRYTKGVMADDSVDLAEYADQVANLANEAVTLLGG